MTKPGRPGASDKPKKKGPSIGTGGHNRRALEGKGPTPKAEDRSWHVAGKRKAANDRLEAARERHGGGGPTRGGRSSGVAPTGGGRVGGGGGDAAPSVRRPTTARS